MRFREIASRVTGVSTPLFGVSWDPPTSDVRVAHEVIVFLEDRRVLFDPYAAERRDWMIESALEIRRTMTDLLRSGGISPDLQGHLKAIRVAAREFVGSLGGPEAGETKSYVDFADWPVFVALGRFRALVGAQIASLAVAYGVDVDEPLASVLPVGDDNDD